jgi:hypothetical protein
VALALESAGFFVFRAGFGVSGVAGVGDFSGFFLVVMYLSGANGKIKTSSLSRAPTTAAEPAFTRPDPSLTPHIVSSDD